MAVTNDITQTNPVVDADFDTWGTKQNNFFDQVRSTVAQLVTQFNALQSSAANFLSLSGGTMTGDQVLADVAPGSAFSAGFRGLPIVTIDADRTFVLTDSGKMVRLNGSTARTWTIPPAGSVGFPLGTVIVLRNASSAAISLTRGSGVTLTIAGTATDKNCTIASRGQATLVKEDTNAWILSGVGAS